RTVRGRKLFGIETRCDQTRSPVNCYLLYVGPLLGGFSPSRLGKHVAAPARSPGRSDSQDFILKRLAFGVLLTGYVRPFALREGSIQQHIPLEIVGIKIRVAMQPFAVLLPEFSEGCCFAAFFNQCRRLGDQRLNCFSLLGRRRSVT